MFYLHNVLLLLKNYNVFFNFQLWLIWLISNGQLSLLYDDCQLKGVEIEMQCKSKSQNLVYENHKNLCEKITGENPNYKLGAKVLQLVLFSSRQTKVKLHVRMKSFMFSIITPHSWRTVDKNKMFKFLKCCCRILFS